MLHDRIQNGRTYKTSLSQSCDSPGTLITYSLLVKQQTSKEFIL